MRDSSLIINVMLALGLVALVGGRLLLSTRGGRRPGYFRFSMAFYLALGLAAGSQGLGLLGDGLLRNLEPVKGLALGWIGLLFGLQLKFSHLRRFPGLFHRAALFESAFSLILVGAALWWTGWAGLSGEGFVWLAVLGGVSSPTATALAAVGGGPVRHRLARLAHFVTSLDPLTPLTVFALSVGYFNPAGGGWPAALEWLAAAFLLGLVLGLLFYSFARGRHEPRELTMLTIAFTVFAGGVGSYLGLSSLFIAVVMGAILANLLPASERVFRELARREKAVLILLLVLTGADWRVAESTSLAGIALCLGVYLAARTAGKLAAMALVHLTSPGALEKGGAWGGLALLGQGGMSLALIASFQLLGRGGAAQTAVTVGLLALVAGEMFSARAARWALYGRGGRSVK